MPSHLPYVPFQARTEGLQARYEGLQQELQQALADMKGGRRALFCCETERKHGWN